MQVLSKLTNLEKELCCNWIRYKKETPDLTKYKHQELKQICKKNDIRVTGNKCILVERILYKYKREIAACLIQTYMRTKLIKVYMLLHGPAYKDKKCTNDTDFYTLEPFDCIHIKDFFSFEDKCGFVFGFDLNSIYNLIKRDKKATNPYNRNEIPKDIVNKVKRIRKLNRVYYPAKCTANARINESIQPPALVLLEQMRNKTYLERVSNLFYEIDQVGNYTSPEWITDLGRDDLTKFVRFLYQLWNYRAGITHETRKRICPYFNPFNYQGIADNFTNTMSLEDAQNAVITICENLFHTAINAEYKKLSAIYILTSLTTVSDNARRNIPWLYESTL